MRNPDELLKEAGVREDLIASASEFRKEHAVKEEYQSRIPDPQYVYYGEKVWNEALSALLAGENILLSGPKATGKNVLADNLAVALGRPVWNVSFHVNADASYLMGTDTYDGEKVVFRKGPVTMAAQNGGICVLDEINMAKNEALAVLHSALDYRHIIDISGYDLIHIDAATRFIGTMNYGYAGTRELNEALTSRFAVISMPVIAKEDLHKLIVHAFPDIRDEIAVQFMNLFYELEEKAAHADISERAVDLRGMLDAIRLMKYGVRSGEALDMCLVNKTFDEYERKLIHDVIRARIPEEMNAEVVFQKKA